MPKHGWKSLLLVGLAAAGQEDNIVSNNEQSVSSERFSQCSRDDYYNSVNIEDRGQLEALLASTHRRRLPYTSNDGGDDVWLAMKELYPGESSDTVRLIYSQTDMAVSLQGALDGWNREHLWPLSYGIGDSGADYTDVHNIAPSDWNVNAVRGNKYFGACSSRDTSSCIQPAHVNAASDTQTNAQVFLPPASVRGDIARALMYMDVRYSGDQEGETDLFLTNCPGEMDNSMGILSQLLQWHVDDPVSEEEQNRNANICTCWQGNRNPFVDFPDLAETYFGASRTVECENGVHGVVTMGEVGGSNNGGGEVVYEASNGNDEDEKIVDAGTDGGENGDGTDLEESNVDSDEDVGDGQGNQGTAPDVDETSNTTNTDMNETGNADVDETSNTTNAESDEASNGTNTEINETSNTDSDETTNVTNTDGNATSTNETYTYGGEETEQRPLVLDKSVSCPGPGSIMVVGFNSDYPDTVALVALERLSQGTTLYMTDNGWTGTEFRDTEGYLKLEIPSQGMAAGTVFGYSQNKSGEFSEYNWESVRGNFDLSQSGDTILVGCQDNSDLTFVTGLTFGGRWFNAGGDTTYSALPDALAQSNHSYVTLSHYDSYRYAGPTSGTAYRLRESIADSDNWESSNDVQFENLASLSFEVAPPIPGEGEEEEAGAPPIDPQTDSLGTSSSAGCYSCWNVWMGVTILYGLHAVLLATN